MTEMVHYARRNMPASTAAAYERHKDLMNEVRRARIEAANPTPVGPEPSGPVLVRPDRPGLLGRMSYWIGWLAADLAKTAVAMVLAAMACLPILPLGAIAVLPLLAVFFRLRGLVDRWVADLAARDPGLSARPVG